MKTCLKLIVQLGFAVMISALQFAVSVVADEPKRQPDANNELVERAKKATRKYQLTTIAPDCLVYEPVAAKVNGRNQVDVREKHGGRCGGDLRSSPRLYSLAFDEATKEVWSDAKSATGQMERIGPE